MYISPIRRAALTHASGRRLSLARALFVCTVLYAGALFWIAPHPPLTDLPQHAGQVALLHDLIEHTSPWQALVRANYFTPYLIGYGVALPLTYVMSVSAALKLVMTVAYYAFVACCVLLRKRFGGDARLDWLFIPGFFGFAFAWGFYTFLVAAPLGLLFVLLMHGYASAPSWARAAAVLFSGIILFFSHGLVFLFACTIGVGFVIIKQKRIARIVPAMLPFVLLGVLCVAYAIVSYERDPLLALSNHGSSIKWDWDWRRPFSLPLYVWGAGKHDSVYLLIGALMLAAPWLLRDGINRRDPAAAMPLLVVTIVWFLVPSVAMQTGYLFQRFALFLMPAYAFVFHVAQRSSAQVEHIPRSSAPYPAREAMVQLMMMLGCWGFLGAQTVRLHRFAIESASFETLLANTEPEERALSLVFDESSPAYISPMAYRHYPAWYQAERHGFVDFNFAWFLPQIVRFKPDRLPAVTPGFFEETKQFDWKTNNGRLYRYFFVRNTQALPAGFFANDECDVVLVRKVDEWSLYERRRCSAN
jgi:hypothetical protein